MRLRLLEVLLRCSELLHEDDATPFSTTREYKSIHRTGQELADSICASVPFHLIEKLSSAADVQTTLNDPDRAMSVLGGFLLLWHVYGAAICSLVPQRQSRWMLKLLKSIGARTNIGLATMLSEVAILLSTALTRLLTIFKTPATLGIPIFLQGATLNWVGSSI